MKTKIGDKVRLKSTPHEQKRGVVVEVRGNYLVIQVNDEEDLIEAVESEVTNLSLAARKAWQSMPDRTVGRPKGTRNCDRVSVTLRIDRDLWRKFRALEAEGIIEDRTTTINSWLRKKTDELSEE